MRVDMNTVETEYGDGTFTVRMPLKAAAQTPAVETPAHELAQVAV